MTPPLATTGAPGFLRRFWLWATLLIFVAVGVAYCNSLRNGFHLDDLYGITPNPYVRSLSYIPQYFVDPSTYNTHAENVDYRPMVTTSFALCYAVSGYTPWAWHIMNLLLHGVVCLCVVALGRALIGSRRTVAFPMLREGDGDLVSLGAGVLFAVHPVTAGCANYMWGRSSLLVAAFLAPATVIYLRAVQRGRAWPVALVSLLLIGALLSKEEAISFLAVAALAEFLFAPGRVEQTLLARFVPRWGDLRLLPLVVVAAAYLAVYTRILPAGQAEHWKNASTTPWQYLLTQTGAWWYYVGKLLLPIHQIADYAGYPTAMPRFAPPEGSGRWGEIRSQLSILGNTPILLSAIAWALVGALVVVVARRLPAVTFLVASFIVYLSPTSSIVPLSEMVNEHRPYLPDACLILLLAAGLFLAVRTVASKPRPAFAALVLALIIPLTIVTLCRNFVFRNELTYWEDCAEKDPTSARAQLNYGMELWKIPGKTPEAERRFREAVRLWPNWLFGHVNLALLLDQKGARDEAFQHFDRAVEVGGTSSIPVYYRGLNRLARGDNAGAEADLRLAVERASVKIRERVGLAKALLALKREDEAIDQINAGRALEPEPFAELAMPLNSAGVDRMAHRELDLARRCFVLAGQLAPNLDLPEINLGVLEEFEGHPAEAGPHFERAVALNPRRPDPYRWRADFREKSGDLSGAIADYRAASDLDARSTSDLAHLGDLYLKTGQRAEAERAITRGEAIDPKPFESLRAKLNTP